MYLAPTFKSNIQTLFPLMKLLQPSKQHNTCIYRTSTCSKTPGRINICETTNKFLTGWKTAHRFGGRLLYFCTKINAYYHYHFMVIIYIELYYTLYVQYLRRVVLCLVYAVKFKVR